MVIKIYITMTIQKSTHTANIRKENKMTAKIASDTKR